jgi:glycosyltransferase involved in cell wall biosynthesis
MPTHNRIATLTKALDSVRNQDYGPLRIVICDNASEDGTTAYAKSVAAEDPRITILRHPTNIGVFANLASGLKHATGEFFLWVCDDDWIERNYIRECVAGLLQEPEAALASGTASYYRGAQNVMQARPLELLDGAGEVRILRYFKYVSDNAAFFGVYRLDRIRHMELGADFGFDWRFLAEVAAAGKFVGRPSTTIHRSLGVSQDIKAVVRISNVPRLFHDSPYAWLAWNVLAQIWSGRGQFGRLPPQRRRLLALQAAGVILRRYGKPEIVRTLAKRASRRTESISEDPPRR